MEKFPKGEMGWISESTVKEYIDRNYVPQEEYWAMYNDLKEKNINLENGLSVFLDYLINLEGADLTIRTAIMAGFSKEFILEWVYDDEERYNQCYADLIAEGEILPDGEEADEE